MTLGVNQWMSWEKPERGLRTEGNRDECFPTRSPRIKNIVRYHRKEWLTSSGIRMGKDSRFSVAVNTLAVTEPLHVFYVFHSKRAKFRVHESTPRNGRDFPPHTPLDGQISSREGKLRSASQISLILLKVL